MKDYDYFTLETTSEGEGRGEAGKERKKGKREEKCSLGSEGRRAGEKEGKIRTKNRR